MFYLYLFAMLMFDLFGLTMAKYWQINHHILYFICSIVSYAIMAVFLILALKYEGVAITNIIWVALSAVGMTLVGFYLFKEPIVFRQLIGIIIIIIGIIIVQWK